MGFRVSGLEGFRWLLVYALPFRMPPLLPPQSLGVQSSRLCCVPQVPVEHAFCGLSYSRIGRNLSATLKGVAPWKLGPGFYIIGVPEELFKFYLTKGPFAQIVYT